tara:strand:+ start:1574 stop:2689 length:1116 start_codon:yes stop_codon:yes gene_type:complete
MTDINQQRIFIENTWYAAAWESEVADNDGCMARTICETPLVIYKTDDDRYVALDDRCCHRAAPLSIGRVEGKCIRCMYHGLLYDPSGKVIEIPGQTHIAPSMKVRSYPLCSKGGMLWLWMGDPELANEDDIHDFAPLSQPEKWRGFEKRAYMHYDANWLLIVDNLSDFSHVAFVHTTTLGGSEDYAYNTIPENIEKLDDGFSMERWDKGSVAAPFHAKVIPHDEVKNKLDRCNITSMHIPGIFLMETIFAPAGWDAKKNDRSSCREYRNCQFMTPETRNTTHFFWDYLHGFDLDKPFISESLEKSLLEGFMEDKVFIEEQQKLLEESPDFVPRVLEADEAFIHFRRQWERRLKAENEANPLVQKENRKRIL